MLDYVCCSSVIWLNNGGVIFASVSRHQYFIQLKEWLLIHEAKVLLRELSLIKWPRDLKFSASSGNTPRFSFPFLFVLRWSFTPRIRSVCGVQVEFGYLPMDRSWQGLGREADGSVRNVAEEQRRSGSTSCRRRVAAAIRAAWRIRFQTRATCNVTCFDQISDWLGSETVLIRRKAGLQKTGEEMTIQIFSHRFYILKYCFFYAAGKTEVPKSEYGVHVPNSWLPNSCGACEYESCVTEQFEIDQRVVFARWKSPVFRDNISFRWVIVSFKISSKWPKKLIDFLYISVQDAAARLPNGEGTRQDIVTLLKDSQYLSQNIMNCILHGAVTYSLERLQLESDPCVKYDARRKVWIYLHRSRTISDFGKT